MGDQTHIKNLKHAFKINASLCILNVQLFIQLSIIKHIKDFAKELRRISIFEKHCIDKEDLLSLKHVCIKSH